MDITETLYVPTRRQWRDWLAAHHFDKRLHHLVKMSAQGKQFGYGIESYF